MANLVEHTMLNGLEENLKSAIEMAGGEIPTDACVWDYPGIIRDQLSSGGYVLKVLPGKGIQVERDSKGNYVVSVKNADTTSNIEINTIQAPSFAVGVEGGQWDKGTILQSFLEDLFSKVLPYVPSVKGGEIIEADEEGNDVFGYDENTGKPLVTNGLDRYNQYIRLSLASQIEPIYISLENLKTNADNIDLLKYFTKEETNKLVSTSISKAVSDIETKIRLNYFTKDDVKSAVAKLKKDIDKVGEELEEDKLNLASNYYTKEEVRAQIASSDVDLSNYYTKSDVENLISKIESVVEDIEDDVRRVEDSLNDTKSNLASNYYNKTEVKDLISNVKVDLSGYYTKTETDTIVNGIEKDILANTTSINDVKSNISTNYYTKDEVKDLISGVDHSVYYTKSETDAIIDNVKSEAEASLNETKESINANISTNYYTKTDVESVIDNKIAEIPEVDLSNHYTKPETEELLDSIRTETSTTIERVEEVIENNTEKITEIVTEIETIKTNQSIDAADYEDGVYMFNEVFNGIQESTQVSSKDDLLSQINSSNHIELASNIELVNTPVVVDKTVEVNLNGKEIVGGVFVESNGDILEGNSDSFAFLAKEGANLTISGQGQVKAQEATYSMAVWANGGTVIINDGVYTNEGNGCDLIYTSNGGKVYIYGGEFIATSNDKVVDGTKNDHSALNIKDAHRDICEILVYGGKFYKFNPGDNVSETKHTSFLAPGYKSVQEGDYFVVVKE